ncbi:MAG: HD domain-containing protein, partial [Ruminiclostridium sp.]|nr:HD domain-containing protein [Ruminiclostridium sp.]
GKIGVPIEILQKKSRLTDEEFEQIKQHPVKGGEILSVIKESPWLSIGARYHHERYDGKGYPEGLKGDEIPEIARIISVADAYDAMTSIRSYRDPIPQDKVREQIVKGSGTQFDPVYARLMVHMIDVDTEYQMKERAKADESDINGILTTGAYREAVSAGIHISSSMTTIRMSISSDDEATGIAPIPSLILFDALDGKVHTDEKEIKDYLYLEYGEIWFDGRTVTGGARKMKSKVENTGADDIKHNGEYKIEAVRIDDHALIRIAGKAQTAEIIVALPDSSRFMYIALTGEHCRISNLRSVKAEETCPDDFIPRIAEKISYIKDAPTGDVPNIQIDGYRKAHSAGVPVRDGLTITFHAKCLPTARLVYHCPFIILYASDDGKVNGKNARDLMLTRFDGECWEHDASCTAVTDVKQTEAFGNWDAWMKYNQEGYDTEVRFTVEDNKITVITENAGVSIRNTAVLSDMSQPVYAAITGDQVAITNIRVHQA